MATTKEDNRIKVMFFGTHPMQFNGYSKVVYELCKCFGNYKDIELSVWGFQNYYKNDKHRLDFPSDIIVYDAWANEDPKASGFGFEQIEAYVKERKPDVCIVYNDLAVLTNCLVKIRAANVPDLKIVAYIDQVYLCQKKEFIDAVNQLADLAIAFSPYWETILKEQGVVIPTGYLQHGVNSDQYYPIPKDIARRYFNLNTDDFIILNVNRNQPRKRWDICLKAFAEVVSRKPDSNIKLFIGTTLTGAWNLIDIYHRELKKRNVPIQVGMRHIIVIDNPQKLTDEEVNILYNAADIGINTADGEGWGLQSSEMCLVGKPQVVPRIGGFLDFLDDDIAHMCDPTIALYIDSSRDAVGGESLICDYTDFVDGIIKYYENSDMLKSHGETGRKKMLEKYRWKDMAALLYKHIRTVKPKPVEVATNVVNEVAALAEEVEKIDIASIQKLINSDESNVKNDASASQESTPVAEIVAPPSKGVPCESTMVGGKRVKANKKVKKDPAKELLKLRRKIDLILSSIDDDDDETDESGADE